MSTALATVNGVGMPATPIDAETLEKVVARGDLAALTPDQKVAWYRARCEAAGLDPRTQPFEYVSLKGNKLKLYATKTATDQLIALHKITVKILARTYDEPTGIYEVHCAAVFPDGRSAEDIGAVYLGQLAGEDLANGVMKAVTKAKRRTILSACGLGMLDDSEIDSIPGAVRYLDRRETAPAEHHAVNHGNASGHGRTGAYADPKVVAEYRGWLKSFVEGVNAKWLDHWTGEHGEQPPKLKELVSPWALSGHLLKWCKALPADDPCHLEAPEEARTRQYDPLVAIAWGRDAAAIETEAKGYCRRLWRAEAAKLAPAEAESQEPAAAPEDESQDADPADDLPERFGGREPGDE